MNTLLKSLGGIILLVGVVIMVIPTLQETHSNTNLFIGLVTIVLGFLLHIFLNKKFE
jgi:dipeptide/tripeptide permease